jgi:PUA-domain protein
MLRKRQSMKRRDARCLLEELESLFGVTNVKKAEEAEYEDKKVYILDDRMAFIRDANGIYPFLGGSEVDRLPSVVVDMGAVPYVCNGADIMAPGIKEITGGFEEGDIVVVRDVTHRKALSVGRALKSSAEIEASRKGRVIQNLHYVGDKLWKLA